MDILLITGFCRKKYLKDGVAIYTKNDVEPLTNSINTHLISSELICELSVVRIKTKHRDLYILGIYRAPKANLDNSLQILSQSLDKTTLWNSVIIIVGDINIDNFDRATTASNISKTKLNGCLSNYNIKRINLGATRKTSTSGTVYLILSIRYNR